MTKLPPLHIGDLVAPVPIIQGGMGIGVSRARLAATVANAGGVGTISAVGLGLINPKPDETHTHSSIRALTEEIQKAKQLAPNGIIAANLLVVITEYDEAVTAASKAGVDLIVSGAGLPLELPGLVLPQTKIAPIVSSARAAKLICKYWDGHYSRLPDLVIVEGPEAGGHLGFSEEDLQPGNKRDLLELTLEVIEAIKPFAEKAGKAIPVVAAGGVYTGADIAKFIKAGAAGVQMATRFAATHECDADIRYKEAYISSKEEDIILIKSPVGLPGRALNNAFMKKVTQGTMKINGCIRCIKTCDPKTAPYCISKALLLAMEGDVENGLVFVGSNAYRVHKIIPVKELMDELISEAEKAL